MSVKDKTIEQLEAEQAELKHGIKRDTRIAWIFAGVGALLAVAGGITICLIKGGSETTPLSRLDSYSSFLQGAVASVWALAGFVLIYVAFLGQKLQLLQQEVQIREQKNQFEIERLSQEDEIKEQKQRFEIQYKSIQKQNFENSLFQMINLLSQTVAAFKDSRWQGVEGRQHCEWWYNQILRKIFSEQTDRKGAAPASKEFAIKCYADFYSGQRGNLGHYFRTLYHTFKLIDRSEIEDKRTYTSLVRAQLSQYELALLFYNCIMPIEKDGGNKFKPLVEKYGLLENFDTTLLLNTAHEDFYAKGAYE